MNLSLSLSLGNAALMRSRSGFSPRLAVFDGTNDFLLRGGDLTGIADGKAGTISTFISVAGGAATNRGLFYNGAIRMAVFIDTSNRLHLLLRNAAATGVLDVSTTNQLPANGSVHHVAASWDLAAGAVQIYLDGASETIITGIAPVNDTIDYTDTNWAIGSQVSGNLKLNGSLGEFWFSPTRLDLSTNITNFRTAAGKAVNVGADGSAPGVTPLVYLSLRSSTASDFATNRGTGGNFSVTGALTEGAALT